jgi:hypothetical protein
VDYDGDFTLTPLAVRELTLLVFLLHQPGQHMVLRWFKKLLYLSAQDASDMLHGGLITMGKRVVVHTDQYDKDMQNAGSTPKELHALSVAVQMATAKFHRGAGNSRHHGGNGGCVAGGSSKMDAARVLEGEGRSVPSAWWRGCYRYRLLWMNSRSTI